MTDTLKGFAVPDDCPQGMGNCGIVAVAMLAGVSHAQAFEAICDARRAAGLPTKLGKGWKGGTTPRQWQQALDALGIEWGEYQLGDRTLGHFAKTQQKDWPMVVYTTSHAMTVCNGLVYDQTNRNGTPVDKHFCRRRKVCAMMFAYR